MREDDGVVVERMDTERWRWGEAVPDSSEIGDGGVSRTCMVFLIVEASPIAKWFSFPVSKWPGLLGDSTLPEEHYEHDLTYTS